MSERWTYVPEARVVEVGEVGNLSDADLAKLDSDELMRLKIAKEEALRIITAQLKQARKAKARTGLGWDPKWFRAAMNAQTMHERQCRLIQAEFMRRKGGTKAERNAALQREFVNVAKEKLSEGVFRMWLDEAARRLRLIEGMDLKRAPVRTHSDDQPEGEKP